MKKGLFVLFLIFFVATLFGGAYLRDFRAYSEDENIRLEWETGDENNVKNFVIERESQESSFIEIEKVNPKGNNSFYSYLDDSIFKTSEYVFRYRLKIVDTDGQVSYSSEISVVPKVSTYKRTWGSIKAMFR
jgi:hypothetical protein